MLASLGSSIKYHLLWVKHKASPVVLAEEHALHDARAKLAQERAVWATEKVQQEEEMQEASNSVDAQRKAFKGKWAAAVKAEKELHAGESNTLCLQSTRLQ